MSMGPTIAVTGGAGYIGSHVSLALRDSNWPVLVVDNLETGLAKLVPDGVEFVNADCGDADRMRDLFAKHQVRAVMHLAASTLVSESVVDPMKYYLNNTVKTARLIESCIRSKVEMFVYSSTAAVYGTAEGSACVSEEVPPRPITPYGRSKLMGEKILADAANAYSLRYIALRYFNVAGADPAGRSGQSNPNATHLISVACKTALGARTSMEIYGTDYNTPDGTCVRDYVHVSDVADAHTAALEHLMRGADSGVLNCGYGYGHSVLDVIAAVRRVTGAEICAREASRRAGDVPELVCSAQRIRDKLGWTPKHDQLSTIVQTAYDWECRQRDGMT